MVRAASVGPALDRCDDAPQSPRRALGVVAVGECPHHGDPARAGVAHTRHGARVDRADRKPRQVRVRRRVGDQLEPDGRAAGLCRRRVDGSDADVVDAVAASTCAGV